MITALSAGEDHGKSGLRVNAWDAPWRVMALMNLYQQALSPDARRTNSTLPAATRIFRREHSAEASEAVPGAGGVIGHLHPTAK